MANQLVEYKKFTFGDLDETMIQTIHETIAKDCTEPQFKLFMTIARSLGANPLLNDIYPTVYQGKLTPQFGIGFYVNQARKHDDYAGYDAQTVHEHDTFRMHQERAEDGRYYAVIDEHTWGFPRGKLLGGYAFAYRTGFMPFTVVMDVSEIEQYLNSQVGMQKTMWTKNTIDMIKKHMSKRALNAAFGLGFEEEQSSESGNGSSESYVRKEINPDATVITEPGQKPEKAPKTKATEASKAIDVESEPVIDEAEIRKELLLKIRENCALLGHKTDEEVGKFWSVKSPIVGKKATTDEQRTFLKLLEELVAAKNDDLPE